MYLYNYNLYNHYHHSLFALSYEGNPQIFDRTAYFRYKALIGSFYDEAVQRTKSLVHDNNNFSYYPMAVRYADPDNNYYIIERPPFQVDLDFSTSRSYKARKTPKAFVGKKIWIPWTVSILSFSDKPSLHTSFNYNLYFNDRPLSSLDDFVIPAYLPNVSPGGSVCMGQDSLKINQTILENNNDIASIYNMAFNSYFAGWNADLAPDFFITSYIKDIIINRVSQLKYCPKSIRDLTSSNIEYSFHNGNNSSYLSKILFSMSSLNLQETLNYVSSVKDHYSDQEVRYSRVSNLSKIINRTHPNDSSNRVYESDFNSLSSISSQLFTHSDTLEQIVSVSINNIEDENSVSSFINNPFIVYKIYEALNKSFHYQTSFDLNFSFDYQEVYQYNKVDKNVADSVSS